MRLPRPDPPLEDTIPMTRHPHNDPAKWGNSHSIRSECWEQRQYTQVGLSVASSLPPLCTAIRTPEILLSLCTSRVGSCQLQWLAESKMVVNRRTFFFSVFFEMFQHGPKNPSGEWREAAFCTWVRPDGPATKPPSFLVGDTPAPLSIFKGGGLPLLYPSAFVHVNPELRTTRNMFPGCLPMAQLPGLPLRPASGPSPAAARDPWLLPTGGYWGVKAALEGSDGQGGRDRNLV